MPRNKIDFDTVRKMGMALPGVAESTMYGSPALKIGKRLLACIAINKSAEPGSLAVRIPFDHPEGLLATPPDAYYLTDPYVHYPVWPVRMSPIHPHALPDLLGIGVRTV